MTNRPVWWSLLSQHPTKSTADRFPFVTFRILGGTIYTQNPKRLPRVYRGFIAGDGHGPW